MQLLGQVIFITICVYAASCIRFTGADKGLIDAFDNGANSAPNAAVNAANAGENETANLAGNAANAVANVVYNVANSVVNAAGNTANAAPISVDPAITTEGNASNAAYTANSSAKAGNLANARVASSNYGVEDFAEKIGIVAVNAQGNALTADDCFASYTIQIGLINNAVVNMTQRCNKNANESLANYTANVNSTLALVNILSLDLQIRLAYCGAMNTTENGFICYAETFDVNVQNLDELTVKSQKALAYMSGYTSSVEIERNSCISSVILLSKLESMCCLNTLQFCLEMIPAN